MLKTLGSSLKLNASLNEKGSYYHFGMQQPFRHWEKPNYAHRFGYNGMEKDDEIKGLENSCDYVACPLDSKLGRFLSMGALKNKFPWWPPYHFAGNSAIKYFDIDCLEQAAYDSKTKKCSMPSFHNNVTLTENQKSYFDNRFIGN